MKKLSLLTLSAIVLTSGLSATLPGYISDIYITNKTDKPLNVGPRIKTFTNWRGGVVKSEQAGKSLTVYPNQEMVKIASVERDQTIATSQFGSIGVEFTVNGQKQSFVSGKFAIGIASTMTYNNAGLGLKNMRLPLETSGLKITPQFKYGKVYQDVIMEFAPFYGE